MTFRSIAVRGSALALALAAAQFSTVARAEEPAPLIAQSCAGCHGQAGAGQGGVPRIAGFNRDLFVANMQAFRANERPATIMGRIARGYSDEEVAELAEYFASLR
jgi:cytochrome subunit of sulfide dehydrogenase